MVPERLVTTRLAVGALVLVLGAGCQSSNVQHASLSVPGEMAPGPLTKAQSADLKIALGRSLEKGGNSERALDLYTEAAAADPKRLDACLRLAALHALQGHVTESRQWYCKALALQPDNADIYCNLGYSHYLQGDLDLAARHLRHALQLSPDHARAHNNLGLVLARGGNTKDAFAEFKKAGCPDADAHVNLAYGLLLEGQADASRQHFEAALKVDPDSTAAKKALRDLDLFLARRPASQPGAMLAANPLPDPAPDKVCEAGDLTSVTWRPSQKKAPSSP